MTANAKRWVGLLILIIFLGRFGIQSYAKMLTNSNAAEGDQRAILQLGLDLREHGTLTDGTRSPLYPAFLAMFAHRGWDYFTWAKLLNMIFGMTALSSLYYLAWHRFGWLTAILGTYLFSLNAEFIFYSATALAEPLLILTVILTWFAMLQALDNPDDFRLWLVAGTVAGLAYLTKGTGQLVVVAFLITALLRYRRQLFSMRSVWLFAGIYGVVALPLWVYNTIYFGSPTFNYAITHQMWMDSWREWHIDATNLPTAVTYLQTHTLEQIIGRQWEGMRAMRNVMVKTLYPTHTLMVDRFLLSPVSGYVLGALFLLPFALWRSVRQMRRSTINAVVLTGLVTGFFFVLFSWYQAIVPLGVRFVLPVIPLILVLAAYWVIQMGRDIFQIRSIRRLAGVIIAVVVLLQGGWATQTTLKPARLALATNVFDQDAQFNRELAAPLAWLTAPPLPTRLTVAQGPTDNALPTWAYSDRVDFVPYPPEADSISALTEYFSRQQAGFIIIDAGVLSRYSASLKPFFSVEDSKVIIKQFPPGWELTFAHRGIPCEWCVFRLKPANPSTNEVSYQLGQSIALTGYDLTATSIQPGDTLYLTLHWAATAQIQLDYTVFTQLLGPDFQLYGQMDHPPIYNLWPTGEWRTGNLLADRYEIPLAANAPVGTYQLLVGMYNPQTGKRLVVTQNNSLLPDNAIFLAQVRVEN